MKYVIILLFLLGCGVPPENWKDTRPSDDQWMASMDVSLERWIVASQYLPKNGKPSSDDDPTDWSDIVEGDGHWHEDKDWPKNPS